MRLTKDVDGILQQRYKPNPTVAHSGKGCKLIGIVPCGNTRLAADNILACAFYSATIVSGQDSESKVTFAA